MRVRMRPSGVSGESGDGGGGKRGSGGSRRSRGRGGGGGSGRCREAGGRGKRAIAAITASGSRVEFRLVLEAEEKGEADELPDPRGGNWAKLRVAKAVMLNDKAVASAGEGLSPSGVRSISVKLTEVGGRQME